MKTQKKSLLKKILMFIGIPVAVAFCAAAVITLNTVNKSVTDLSTKDLADSSKAASFELSQYFNKYIEVAKQMATNSELEALFMKTQPGMPLTSVEGFAQIKQTLDNVQKTDSDGIVVSWIADIDSSQLIQSDGYITGADYRIEERPWYQELVERQDVFLTEPFVDAVSGNIIISVVAPVYQSGTTNLIGAACIDVSIDKVYAMLQNYKFGETGFLILATGDGKIFYHPNDSYNNKDVAETDMSDNLKSAILDKTVGNLEFTSEGQRCHGYVSAIGDTGWAVATGMPNQEFQSTYNNVRTTVFFIFAIALLIIIALIVIISRRIVSPLKRLAVSADRLAVGDVEVDVSGITASKDEVGLLAESFDKMIANIKEQAEAAKRIAEGDLSAVFEPKSDKDILTISLISVINTLRGLIKEAEELGKAAAEGKLDARGNAEQFQGGYRDIIERFNVALDTVISPLKLSAEYMERISKGDIPEKITDRYHGDIDEIKDSINTCIDAVNALIQDAGVLSKAAVEGNLSVRADASRHGGDFAKIVEGVNQTLDSVIGPLNVAAEYINKIGKGEIPPVITDIYYGDFNEIKNSINACIDGLGALVEGSDILQKMSHNDYSEQVAGNYSGIYAEISRSINAVSDRVRNIVEIVNNIAVGSLTDLDEMKAVGKRSEKDTIVPAFITMIESISMLVEETRMLSASAVEGKLDIRGDISKFNGEYASIIKGINATLDAVIEPVTEALTVLKEMEHGNLRTRMDGNYQGDHAEIKNALNATITNLLNYVSEISSVLAEIGKGNLDQKITADYRGDFVEIKDSLNDIIISLSQVMGNISEAADQVASGSKQVSDGSQSLSQGSTEQASSIEELTASIAEIASQIKQNAVNANKANELATGVRDKAVKGNNQMQEMLHSMVEINESSANISKIIKVIDDIAFQTNILALNAAVEAARAGQHGKGFAVVAEEVRNLAARSADAAKETTALIEGSINKVHSGTGIANETASALNEIVAGVEEAATLVGSIAEASNTQASGIAQVNVGIEQVSLVVQNNSATAEESAAASEELSGQAELLKEMVGHFKRNKEITVLSQENKKLLMGNTLAESKSVSASPSSPRILLGSDGYDKY